MISIGTLKGFIELEDNASSTMVLVANTVERAGKKLDSIASSFAKHGAILTAGITVPLIAGGKAALEAGTSFIRTMNQVSAVTNTLPADFDRLSKAALEWGQKTKYSATESAEAMLELGKAGFDTNSTIAALPSVLELAAAANLSLGDAATLTSNVMKTYGLGVADLAHVNDVLAAAANSSTIEVSDLRESIKYVGPVASQTGVSVAQTAAAMALMGEAGIKGSMAGTSLRNVISTLIAPTNKQAEIMRTLGLNSVYANGKMEDLSSILDTLRSRGANTAQVMELFGDRAGPAMAALVERGGAALRKLTTDLDNSEGAAKRMSDAYMKGLPGAIEQLRGSVETARTALLSKLEPSIVSVTNSLRGLADFVTETAVPAFAAMPKPIQQTAFALTGVAAVTGPALLALAGVAKLGSTAAVGVGLLSSGLFTLGNTVPLLTARYWLMNAAGGALAMTLSSLSWIIAAAGVAYASYTAALALFDWIGLSDRIEYAYLKLGRWVGLVDKNATDQDLWNSIQAQTARRTQETADATAALTEELLFVGPVFEDLTPKVGRSAKASEDLAKALDALRKQFSGEGLLADARNYETTVKAIGGASRLTADETSTVAKAYEEVVAKYRLLGPAGQQVVDHFAALRRELSPIPALAIDIESRLGSVVDNLDKIGKRVDVKGPTLDLFSMALTVEQLQRAGLFAEATLKKMGITIGTLPNVTSSAKEGIDAVRRSSSALAESLKATLLSVPQTVVNAFTGNGGLLGALKGIGTQVGAHLGEVVGKTVTALGSFGGPIGAAIGSLAGPVIGALGKLFSSAEKQVNPVREAFIKAAGGLDVINVRAHAAGLTLDRVLNAKNPQQYQAAIEELTRAFEFQDQTTRFLKETTEKYGFTIEELGPALSRQQLGEQGALIYKEWTALTAAGVDIAAVAGRMSVNVQDFLRHALVTGQAVPAAMRPMLEQMIAMGQLTDLSGNKIEDLDEAGVTFSDDVTKAFRSVADEIHRLIQAIQGGLTPALNAIPRTIDIDGHIRWRHDYESPEVPEAHTGALVTTRGVQKFHAGAAQVSNVLRWPTLASSEVPAILKVGESVLNPEATAALGPDTIRALNRHPGDLTAAGDMPGLAAGAGAGARSQPIQIEQHTTLSLDGRPIKQWIQRAINSGEIVVPDSARVRRSS